MKIIVIILLAGSFMLSCGLYDTDNNTCIDKDRFDNQYDRMQRLLIRIENKIDNIRDRIYILEHIHEDVNDIENKLYYLKWGK